VGCFFRYVGEIKKKIKRSCRYTTKKKPMSSRKKARRSPDPDPDPDPDLDPELVLADRKARDVDKMRTSELKRHNAELAVAASQRAAARAQRDREEEVRVERFMNRNAGILMQKVENEPVPRTVRKFVFRVEYDSYEWEDVDNRNRDLEAYSVDLDKLLSDFFHNDFLVPSLEFSFDRDRPRGKHWRVDRVPGAANVKRDHISNRKVVNFSRTKLGSGVAGMCSDEVRCYFNEGVNEMRTLDHVQFELDPFDEPEELDEPAAAGAAAAAQQRKPSLSDPIAPAFFAGEFYAVQNKKMIRVKGPALKTLRNKTDYLTRLTVQADTPDAKKDTMPLSVVGLHIWDDFHVILITQLNHGIEIVTINRQNAQVKSQILPDIRTTQTQVAHVADDGEPRLFLLNRVALYEFTNGPDGFVKVNHFPMDHLLFKQLIHCFYIQQGQICVGLDSFVAFYNFDKFRRDQTSDRDFWKRSTWKKNLDFYVVCKEPHEIMFVSPDSKNQVLVSAQRGVELWTL